MKIYSSALFTLIVIWAVAPKIVAAQEKQKPGTTVDSWRQSLPPEAQVQAAEMPGVAAALPSDDETHKTLLALEKRWMDSLKIGDAESLGEIISADFTFASPRLTAEVGNRTRYFDYAVRDLKLTSYEFDKATVRLFGRTAIVSCLLKQKATVGGADWGGSYLVTDVWLNRAGIWRVVSRHESPLPEQK